MPGRRRVWWLALPPVVGITALLTLVATARPAAAHVSVRADNPAVGQFTKLTFRAPSESSDSATVRLEITIPQQPPVLFIRLRPHPGWKITTRTRKLGRPQLFEGEKVDSLVTAIVLTADTGKGIPPRQFDEFDVTAGPLPDVRTLEFPVLQEYDDGRTVRWDQRWDGRGPIPRHPVPHIALADPAAQRSRPPAVHDPVARWLGGGGLFVAALGLGMLLYVRRMALRAAEADDEAVP